MLVWRLEELRRMVATLPGGTVGTGRSEPARPARTARRLAAQERLAYERDGYVVVPDVFAAEELAAIDREIDRLIAEPGNEATGPRAGWIFQVARRSDLAAAFAEDERLLALIKDVVVPGVAIHSTKLVTKLPHSDEVCHWHQDEAFYLKPDDPATYSRTRMSVWVPLQEAAVDNGCLWVVPGSHTWGLEDYTVVDHGTCVRKIDREAYAREHGIPVPVDAGAVVLFNAYTWHSSQGNRTARVRRAFIVSYQEASVPKGLGQQWKILRPAQP
jgi:ectoine hydroxylase-related dioxygenase (phytanoyl-CoA dioxygenase family)